MFSIPAYQLQTLRSLAHSLGRAFGQRANREYLAYGAAPDAPVTEELIEQLNEPAFDRFARDRKSLPQPEPRDSDAFHRALATALGVEPIPAVIEDDLGVEVYQHLISRFYSAYEETRHTITKSPAARRSRWMAKLESCPQEALESLEKSDALQACLLVDDVVYLLERVGEDGTDVALRILEKRDVSGSVRQKVVEQTLWAVQLRHSLQEAIEVLGEILDVRPPEESSSS